MNRLMIIALLAISNIAFAQSGKNFIDQPYIEVTGKATLEVIPDEIYLDITIKENEGKTKKSLAELENSMAKALENIGINIKEDLTIKDFASNFQDYIIRRNDIVASKDYQLLVHSAQDLGKVYMELEKLGISNITINRTDHSKIEELSLEVKTKAIKAGRNKAAVLAEAAGQKIGNTIHIRENDYNVRKNAPMVSNISVKRKSFNGGVNPDISFDKITLESNIHLKIEIQPINE